MKTFKKIISLLLVVCMMISVLSLVACSKDDKDDNNNDDKNDKTTNKTYTVTILDGDNNPVEGAKVIFTDGNNHFTQPITTDANGKVATTELADGTISVMLSSVPDGYEKPAKVSGPYHGVFASESTELTIKVEKEASGKVTYTITVVDQRGDAVEGMEIQLCPGGVCLAQNYTTDEFGEITVEIKPGEEVHIKLLTELTGYTLPAVDGSGYHAAIPADETEIEIEITKN